MWDTLDSDSDYTASGEEEEQEEQEDQGEKEEEEEEVSRSYVMSDCVARFCFTLYNYHFSITAFRANVLLVFTIGHVLLIVCKCRVCPKLDWTHPYLLLQRGRSVAESYCLMRMLYQLWQGLYRILLGGEGGGLNMDQITCEEHHFSGVCA